MFVCWYSFPTVCILTFYFSLFYPFTFLFISLTSDFISIYIHTLKHKLLSVVSTALTENTFIYERFFIFLTHMSLPKKSLTQINWVFIFSQNHFLFIYYIVTHFPFFLQVIATNSLNMLYSCTTASTELFFTKKSCKKTVALFLSSV